MSTPTDYNLLDELTRDLQPVIPINPLRRVLSWVCLSLIYIAICVALFGIRADFSVAWQSMMFQAECFLALCVTVNSGVAALLLSTPKQHKLYHTLAIPLVALCSLSIIILLSGEISMMGLKASMKYDHLMVTAKLCAFAFVPLITLFTMVKKAAPTHLAVTGAMLCVAGSASAYLILRLIMAGGNIADVLIWCYAPVLLLGICGALLGRVLLRW